MLNLLKKLFLFLSIVEKKQLIKIFFLTIIMAIIDVIGVASIMPFIAILVNPELIETNVALKTIYGFLGFNNINSFLNLVGITFFVILIFSLIFKGITTYIQIRYAMFCEYSISKKFIEVYLSQQYSWFLSQHSAKLAQNILSETNNLLKGVILPLMVLFSQIAVSFAIILLLIFIDPLMTLFILFILGGSYFGIYNLMSKKLSSLGRSRLLSNEYRFTSVAESFGAIKEVKIGGHEMACVDKFNEAAKKYSNDQVIAEVIATIPRFIFEAIAFGGMLLLILYLMSFSTNFTSLIPLISLYAFAGYRLMPALQFIYRAVSNIKFSEPTLDSLYKDFKNLQQSRLNKKDSLSLNLKKFIKLENIEFSYPGKEDKILKNITLTINTKESIAFVGKTGSGKTTILDLVLGLLKADKGKIFIDGKELNEKNIRSWQSVIGYVPQEIYLSNKSILENIAFGFQKKIIDIEKVINVSKIAQLHEFVEKDLKLGYETIVGERGVQLSGGQRQRIGIARALYSNPDVLVLDEATSALDNLTEKKVIDSINSLNEKKTIIMVAHRLSTIQKCNQIFLVENGEIIAKGKYETLMRENKIFNSMIP